MLRVRVLNNGGTSTVSLHLGEGDPGQTVVLESELGNAEAGAIAADVEAGNVELYVEDD